MLYALDSILGHHNASMNPIDLAAYSYDGSQQSETPTLILWPKDVEVLRRTLVRLHTAKAAIVPRGFGTNLVGATLAENKIVMDMTKMSQILKLDRTKKEVVVEAGCSFHELNDFLATHDLTIPIHPMHDHHTIGGMIALNTVGAWSYHFGRMAEWIESYRFFDATGKLHTTKDVTLLTGTEGTSGLITQATLRVTSVPQIKSISIVQEKELTLLLNHLTELKREEKILSIEYLDKSCSHLVGLEEKHTLIISHLDEEGRITDEEHIREYLEKRESIDPILSSKGALFREDCALPSTKIYDVLTWLEKRGIPTHGHIGLGILLPYFKPEEKRDRFYKFVMDQRGSVEGAYGIGTKKRAYISKQWKDRIMKLKEEYDYFNQFNPSKVINYR